MLDESTLPSLPSFHQPDRQRRPLFADVMLPRYFSHPFTYAIPGRFQESLRVGHRVLVPFGKKILQGLVVSLHDRQPPAPRPTYREIQDLLDQTEERPEYDSKGGKAGIEDELLALAHFVSEYYLTPLGQCLRFILPPFHAQPASTRIRLTGAGRETVQAPGTRLSAYTRAILERLQRTDKGLTRGSLRRAMPGRLDATLRRLKQRGLISEEPVSGSAHARSKPHPEDPRVSAAPSREERLDRVVASATFQASPQASPISVHSDWTRVREAISSFEHRTFLLEGSRPSRYAWFIAASSETLARGRSVLIVTPEIRHAGHLAALATASWPDRVTLLHSDLPLSRRKDLWHSIRAGSTPVVVGTRSAIFAPLPDIGLIVIDEEESSSLKEEQSPHYHARTVGLVRARSNRAILLLGSDHPSLETYTTAVERPFQVTRFEIEGSDQRTRALPGIVVSDLRESPSGTLLTKPLVEGMAGALAAGTGAILFLNRKGYAPALLCRTCGRACQCPTCHITQRFFKTRRRLVCHYCAREEAIPDLCQTCSSPRLEPVGFGTERLEEAVRQMFPAARIGRLDREAIRTEAQAEDVRAAFRSGTLHILIGTQLLLEGDAIPPAGCVGVPCADVGLHLPDFRSAERAFHAFMETRRLGRPMEDGGVMVLQTSMPTHHTMLAVAQHDPSLFYEQERSFRRALAYPPFTHMIRLRVSGSRKDMVLQAARCWAELLHKEIAEASRRPDLLPGTLEVLGPIAPMIPHVRGQHRQQLFVKAEPISIGQDVVRQTLDSVGRSRGLKVDVDVDPVDTL